MENQRRRTEKERADEEAELRIKWEERKESKRPCREQRVRKYESG